MGPSLAGVTYMAELFPSLKTDFDEITAFTNCILLELYAF